MVGRIFGVLTTEIKGMHRAAYVLAGFTVASSLLGFVRDRLLAHAFGAGHTLDLYYAAFRIPDLLFVTIASLISVYVLIPELESRSESERQRYIDAVFSGFFIIMVVAAGVLWLLAPAILAHLFPAVTFRGELPALVSLTRLLLLQPIFLGISNILASVVQAKNRYALYAFTPLMYNSGIIVGILVLYPLFGLRGLVSGAVLGAFLHALVQLPLVLQEGYLRKLHAPTIRDWLIIQKTALTSLPRTMALSAGQIVTLVLVALAGTLAPGSIAIFTFASNLIAVPLSVIGASYSVAAFPVLAAMLSRGERERFVDHVALAARHILFWSMPISAFLIVLRAYAVRAILGTGAFDWTDTRLTAAAFALFALSLSANALSLLVVRAYYAAGRSFVPFMLNAVSGLCSVAIAYALLQASAWQFPRLFAEVLLRVADVPGTEVLVLPLAYTMGSVVSTLILIYLFNQQFTGFIQRIGRVFWESAAAAIGSGAVVYGVLYLLGNLEETSTLLLVVFHGTVAGIAGLAATLAIYMALGSRECQEMLDTLQRRITRAPLVGSAEPEISL